MKTNVMIEKGFHADKYLWIKDSNNNFVLNPDGTGIQLEYSEGFEELNSETEYVVTDSVWITIKNKSINITSSDEGIEASIYDIGYADRNSLASVFASY